VDAVFTSIEIHHTLCFMSVMLSVLAVTLILELIIPREKTPFFIEIFLRILYF